MSQQDVNNEFQELDSFFAKTLHDASVEPSPELWTNIESKLDEDKKKKKRYFFWLFSLGLILTCGTVTLGYFLLRPVTSENRSIALKSSTLNQSTPEISSERVAISSNTTSIITSKNISPAHKKIQIGAFKNANAKLPKTIKGMPVLSEMGEDGINRFFVKVNEASTDSVLSHLMASGYANAFVMNEEETKHNNTTGEMALLSASNKIHVTANAFAPTKNAVLKKSSGSYSTVSKAINKPEASINGNVNNAGALSIEKTNSLNTSKEIATSSEINTQNTPKEREQPSNEPTTIAQTQKSTKASTNNEDIKANLSDNSKQTSVASETTTESTLKETGQPPNTLPGITQSQDTVNTLTASENKDEPPKTDSVKKEEISKESIVNNESHSKKDSLRPNPPKRFGLYLLGGPVITQTLPDPNLPNELSPVTFNAGLKFQFLLFKNVGIELGANYQKNSFMSRDGTLRFSKFNTNDSKFQSSFGEMSVSYNDMMRGFAFFGPIDTFSVTYTYKINYSVLNIPLALRYYLIKKDKLAVSFILAANNQLILNKSVELVLHKEHQDEIYAYNNIPGKKYTLSLLFGLGAEYRLYKNLHFVLEPSAKYYITTPGRTAIKPKLFNIDGNIGLKIVF